jgi:uncharacterized protein YggE
MKNLTNQLNAGFIILAMCLTCSSFAQAPVNEEKPFIEVTGTAEMEVVPDEIFISIVIREKYVKGDKITIESQEEKLKDYLKTIGVDIKNLYLTDANADFEKVKWRTKDVLTQKVYTLKVPSALVVGQVFQQLEKLEILDASIARVNHTRLQEFKKDVKINAIKAAKAKADYLLTAIGEVCGKPLIIQERDFHPMPMYANARASKAMYEMGSDKKETEPEMEFRKIKIEAQIYVKFGIK